MGAEGRVAEPAARPAAGAGHRLSPQAAQRALVQGERTCLFPPRPLQVAFVLISQRDVSSPMAATVPQAQRLASRLPPPLPAHM